MGPTKSAVQADRQLQNLREYGSGKHSCLSWQTTSKSLRIWVRQIEQFELTDNFKILENMGQTNRAVW